MCGRATPHADPTATSRRSDPPGSRSGPPGSRCACRRPSQASSALSSFGGIGLHGVRAGDVQEHRRDRVRGEELAQPVRGVDPDAGRQVGRLVLRIAEQQQGQITRLRVAVRPHLPAVERVVARARGDQRHDRGAVAQSESDRSGILLLESLSQGIRAEVLGCGLLLRGLRLLRCHVSSLFTEDDAARGIDRGDDWGPLESHIGDWGTREGPRTLERRCRSAGDAVVRRHWGWLVPHDAESHLNGIPKMSTCQHHAANDAHIAAIRTP